MVLDVTIHDIAEALDWILGNRQVSIASTLTSGIPMHHYEPRARQHMV